MKRYDGPYVYIPLPLLRLVTAVGALSKSGPPPTQRELAARLHVPQGTVMSKLRRARKQRLVTWDVGPNGARLSRTLRSLCAARSR